MKVYNRVLVTNFIDLVYLQRQFFFKLFLFLFFQIDIFLKTKIYGFCQTKFNYYEQLSTQNVKNPISKFFD